MEMAKTSVWRGDFLKGSPDVSPDLAGLAVEALSTPALDVLLQVVPDETARVVGPGPRWAKPWIASKISFLC